MNAEKKSTTTVTTVSEVFWTDRAQNRIKYRVKRLAKKFNLNHHDREDLVQEFLMALIKAGQSYDPDRGPAGALITGTLNRLYKKFVRKLKLEQQRAFNDAMGYEDVDPEFDETFVDPSQTHLLEVAELRMDIESAFSRLTAKQRRLCLLLQHHSIAETAVILGQTRKNIYRVLGTIRKRFVEVGFEK